ncbi:MAG: DNA polymerase III subunit gamma/tau [Symbiopectobacterium sp.]|uniref:DNA polymerase III subunit gamma/tau n=1 Tax=Symbiopectobacterium sp. TaxID=2952789 RepID=UPI003F2E1889
MSYQVLARKWRPQSFADVVGQEHVLTALANGLSMGRVHHAYLFSGTRGVGKTSIARLLAKGLNCESGVTATPCGQCANCREIEQGRFVDLIEIDAASRTKVEDIRELLDNVQYAPARGRFKVYLIDEVHMLSRYSFNALLKTLEEPPEYVKFLLATTDPQKLPVTILSRCLQFHLKALDVEQIRHHLEQVLQAETIATEPRALQLLARAAEGSLRDALSLTDQAIAMGQGAVLTDAVARMLGTLDDEQPLALIEAIVNANGEQTMVLLQQAESRGVEWEALLVEMLTLLHRIAMVQLLPTALGLEDSPIASRLRDLARAVPPADVQLYYQTLLVGRKELSYAPARRMGVEMTLLRALAFHPQAVIAPVATVPVVASAPAVPQAHITPARQTTTPSAPPSPVAAPSSPIAVPEQPVAQAAPLPDTTSQLLQARSQLLQRQGTPLPKKSKPVAQEGARPGTAISALERSQQRQTADKNGEAQKKPESYRWRAQQQQTTVAETTATPKALRTVLEYEKTPELAAKLTEEAQARDAWAAEVQRLSLPKLVQQLALNSFKVDTDNETVTLHLRSSQHHLNSSSAQKTLMDALAAHYGKPITLVVVEDDDPSTLTPLEWRQTIYEEKLAQARESLMTDKTIQTLRRFFDAELDEESIRPV